MGARLKVFQSGAVVIWDQFCFVWRDNIKRKVLGTHNKYT